MIQRCDHKTTSYYILYSMRALGIQLCLVMKTEIVVWFVCFVVRCREILCFCFIAICTRVSQFSIPKAKNQNEWKKEKKKKKKQIYADNKVYCASLVNCPLSTQFAIGGPKMQSAEEKKKKKEKINATKSKLKHNIKQLPNTSTDYRIIPSVRPHSN